jgi:hypothetical protein
MSRAKLWVGLAVLFGAGVATGIVGSSFYDEAMRASRGERGPAAQHERIMKRLTQELSLTPQQRSEIEPVVTRAHTAILELRFAHQAEIEDILAKGMVDIKAKLSPEQQSALDNMYAGLQRRWRVSRSYLEAQKRSPAPQR